MEAEVRIKTQETGKTRTSRKMQGVVKRASMMKINILTRVYERRRNSLKNVIKKRRPKCPKNNNTRPDLWSEISEKGKEARIQ